MKHNYVIGIDFGNTLTYKLSGHGEESRQLFPYALEIVQWMTVQWPVHIISKVNVHQQAEVEYWLKANGFLARAGIPAENLHFCAERTDKNAICVNIGATHHIDDRPEVFSNFEKGIKGILFRPVAEDVLKFFHQLTYRNVVIAHHWEDVMAQFTDYTNFPFV